MKLRKKDNTSEKKKKVRIMILTQYAMPEFKRNMNAYQRIALGSKYADIFLLVRKNVIVSQEIMDKVSVHRAFVQSRWLFFFYAVCYACLLRLRGGRIILTEPSGFAGVGLLAKFIAGYLWVMDVWDRPRWRTGHHEEGKTTKFSDRFVFWIMSFADIYLLSVLPNAAKDIKMDLNKQVQLYNAIDLRIAANQIPQRRIDDQGLELAFARSKFHWTVGLQTVVKAAELLKQRNCPVKIHLIGEVRKEEQEIVRASTASDIIQMHGFINITRIEFFKKVHVGLATYDAFEDLSYIFPIKVLEHLSQGNPVIVSRLPGLCAMVQDGYNGLVVDPGNPESLAQAIERLQADYDLYHRLAHGALESIKKFDVEQKTRIIFKTILNWKRI